MIGPILQARDLRPLSDPGLLHLAVRFALRSEPWCPLGGEDVWNAGVDAILRASVGESLDPATARGQGKAMLNLGARGARSGEAEHVWRGRNQAACVLEMGLRAAVEPARTERWRRVRDASKHAASIYALQAPAGRAAIDDVISVAWATMRADLPGLACASGEQTVETLRALGPLWPGGEPTWARPV